MNSRGLSFPYYYNTFPLPTSYPQGTNSCKITPNEIRNVCNTRNNKHGGTRGFEKFVTFASPTPLTLWSRSGLLGIRRASAFTHGQRGPCEFGMKVRWCQKSVKERWGTPRNACTCLRTAKQSFRRLLGTSMSRFQN